MFLILLITYEMVATSLLARETDLTVGVVDSSCAVLFFAGMMVDSPNGSSQDCVPFLVFPLPTAPSPPPPLLLLLTSALPSLPTSLSLPFSRLLG